MIVYLATNKINGKRYIGATKHSLKHRWTGHWHDANGRNFCRIFGAAMRKYGRDGFDWSVLARCSSKEEMVREEIRLIAELNPEYNITIGGQGIFGVPYTEERRAKLSKSLKGKKLSPARRAANAERLRQLAPSRHKPVVCLTDGKFFPSCKAAAEFYGVTHGNIRAVTRGKQALTGEGLSFALSDVPLSPEDCQSKIATLLYKKEQNLRRAHSSKCRPVLCLTDGSEYRDAKTAAPTYGISASRVRQLCRFGGSTQSGFSFSLVGQKPVQKKHLTEVQIAASAALREAALRRGILKNSKRVVCLDDGVVYDSISDASRAIGRCVESVSASIRRNGRSGGKSFQFLG